MFVVVTPEVALLIERIMAFQPRIDAQWRQLPARARNHYLREMLINEIQASNEIEQVRSTRQEIGAALDALDNGGGGRRFSEMVRLYRSLGGTTPDVLSESGSPQTLAEIRAAYDAVGAGEIAPDDAPDGALFRRGSVSISTGIKVVHRGIEPEAAINQALTEMLEQSGDESIPRLVRAVMSHFIFEYAHPFYDGNGRTGRFLLGLELRSVLAIYSSLALSKCIADNKSRYYGAFTEVEHPLNRGDATAFVITMLELIAEAQGDLLLDLSERRRRLVGLAARVEIVADDLASSLAAEEGGRAALAAAEVHTLLMMLGEVHLFDVNQAVKLETLVTAMKRSVQYVRPRVQLLVDAGFIETISRRPLRYRLTEDGARLLELGGG